MLPNKKTKLNLAILLMAAALGMAGVVCAAPMGTAFTYQGRLSDANSPAEGLYDFEFAVYDALDGGSQQGSTVSKDDVGVIESYFTVPLDFGGDPNIFSGDARWLEIAVRPGASIDPCDFDTLSPRQELTPAPYALQAKTVSVPLLLIAEAPAFTAVLGVGNTGDGVAIAAQGKNGDLGILGGDDAGVAGVGITGLAGSFTGDVDVTGDLAVGGTVNAAALTGDGSGLTNLPGITVETDPTVLTSVKDGVSWGEVSGRPAGLDDGDDVGITSETDPTVLTSVKDGVSWGEVSGRPAGLDDGDDVGITSETDPQVGANTTNYLSKWNGSALVAGTVYDNGNVGIGTTSPSAKLDVEVSSGGAATIGSSLNSATGDYAIAMGYEANASGNYSTAMGFRTTASRNYSTAMGSNTTASGNGSTAMGRRITTQGDYSFGIGLDSSSNTITQNNTMAIMGGNVGIGTTSPTDRLEVVGNITALNGSQAIGFRPDAANNRLHIDVGGTGHSTDQILLGDAAVGSNDVVTLGNVGIGTTSSPSYQLYVVDSQGLGHIAKFENTNTSIHADGIIIETGPLNNPTSSNSFITFQDGNGTQVGWVRGNFVGGVTYATSSDARLKTNIDDFTGGLDMVSRMKVRKYEFIEAPGKERIGFLAQELQTVFPQAVSGDPEGDVAEEPMGIDYGRVTPVLVSSIQELIAENEALKQRLEALEEMMQQHLSMLMKVVQ